MRELNPLAAGLPNWRRFGMKATAIKFGVIGALAGTEYFVVRKHPASAKLFHHSELGHGRQATTGLADAQWYGLH